MILLELFLSFLWVGAFTFGGAYAAIPLIREAVISQNWLAEDTLTHMIAVSESTPGPIMVNMATYVGSSQGGLPGAALATLAVVLPSFVVILLILTLLKPLIRHRLTKAVLSGMQPCIVGIILATGLGLLKTACLHGGADLRAMAIAAVLGAVLVLDRGRGKKLSAIHLILISAALGAVLYGI